MDNPQIVLSENSMYSDATGRAALVADPKMCNDLFFINFLGFLGLYALNDSRGYMKTHETSEKKLKINEIADENHDSSLIVKLCVDAGILSEAKTVGVTKLLALIKQRTIRAADINDVKVRELIVATQLHTKPMSGAVHAVVAAYVKGDFDVKEYSRQIYECMKRSEWRDFTLEIRNIIVKGQYTDYFTVMKRQAAAGITGAPAKPIVASVKPDATSSAPVATPAAPVVKPDKAKAEAEKAAAKAKADSLKKVGAWMVEIYVDGKGDVEKLRRACEIEVNNTRGSYAEMAEAVGSSEHFPDDAFERSMAVFHDTIYSNRQFMPVREALTRRALQFLLHTKRWSGVYFSTSGPDYPTELKELVKESTAEAVRTFSDPMGVMLNHWQGAANSFNREHPGIAVRAKFVEDNANAASETEHKAWLFSLLDAVNGTVLVNTPLSRKAKAWVNANGKKLSPKVVAAGTTMTREVWKAMSGFDQAMWVANNFSSEGATKLRALAGSSYELRTGFTDEQAQAIAAAVGGAWLDAALIDTLCLVSRPDYVSTTFVAVAWYAGVSNIVNSATLLPSTDEWKRCVPSGALKTADHFFMQRVAAKLSKMPLTTASEVEAFVKRAGSIWKAPATRESNIFPIDPKSSDINESGVAWLFFATYGRTLRNVITTTASETANAVTTLRPSEWQPEVLAWVKTFGLSGPRRLETPRVVDTAEAYGEIIVRAAFYDSIPETSISTTEAVKDEIRNQGKVWWRRVMDATLELSRFNGGVKSSLDNFTDSIWVNNLTGFDEAAQAWMVNNVPFEQLKDARGVAGDAFAFLEAPITPDKLKFVLYCLRSGYYASALTPEIAQLVLEEAEEGSWTDPTNLKSMKTVITVAGQGSVSNLSDFLRESMAAGKDYIAPFVLAPTAPGGPLGASDNYDLHRWAWGLTVDNIKAIIEGMVKYPGATYVTQGMVSISIGRMTITPEMGITDAHKKVTASEYGYSSAGIVLAAWGDAFADVIAKSFGGGIGSASSLERFFETNEGDATGTAIATKAFTENFAPAALAGVKDADESSISRAALLFKAHGGTEFTGEALMKAWIDTKGAAWPVNDIALFLEFARGSGTIGMVDKASMVMIINKLSKSTSKTAIEAIPNLAFSDSSTAAVNPDFIEAVRAARCERAVMNRLRGMNVMQQAVDVINQDPNAASIKVDGARVATFLKFNDVDLDLVATDTMKTLEDLGQSRSMVAVAIPKLMMEDISTPEIIKARTKDLHNNNQYNHSPRLGLEVKRAFKVSLAGQQDRFDAWVAAHPTSKIMTLYHGTGTINAAFILRFGFKIIKSTDASVTGRMLGDGIYFADNINKSMLYMSNAGYVRAPDQEGYVFRCRVALGDEPKDHREGNASRSGLVSNEWAVFDLDQIVIEEAYYGFSRERGSIMNLVAEANSNYEASVSTFMFMDGRVPVSSELTVDFDEMIGKADHVWVETSAKGPIVCIRHDNTVGAVNRCYRYGEELQAAVKAKELKQFLALVNNRY